MDLNSTRTAANTIDPQEQEKPKQKYGEFLTDYYSRKVDSLPDEFKDPERIAQHAYSKASDREAMDYDMWKSFHGVDEFVANAPTAVEKYREKKAFEESQPESRGFLGGSAAALGRGAMNVVGAAGQTLGLADLEPSSIDTNKGYLDRVGEGMTQWAEEKKANTQFMRPTKAEENDENSYVKKSWEGGVESIVTSAAPIAAGFAGAKAGAAAGSVLGPAGAAAGATIGGLGAYALARFGMFGAGVYGDTYDKTYAELKAKNPTMPEDEVRRIANKGSWIDAASENISESAGDAAAFFTFGGTKLLQQPLKATLKDVVRRGIKGIVGDVAKQMPFEVGSEVANAYVGAQWREEAGLDGGDANAAMLDAIGPAVVMSLLMGGGVAGYTEVKARKAIRNINSEDPIVRAQTANEIALKIKERTKDDELAEAWRQGAFERIERGEAIDINEQIASFAANKARADAADEGEDIAVEPDESEIPVTEAPEPKSDAERLLTDDQDVTPEELLLGTSEPSVVSESQTAEERQAAFLEQEEARYQREQAEASGQTEDLDAQWASRADERNVAAETRMLDAEWDTRQRIVELEREIKSLSTGRGKGTKKRMAAVQEAKRELKRLKDSLAPTAPVAEEIVASPQAVGNIHGEQVQNLHELAPAQVDKQTAAAITKLEKRIANIEKIPEKKRSAKNQEKLDNLKMELATLTRAAQPLPMGAEYGEAGYGAGGETVAAGGIGEGVAPGVGREVGAISEPGQIGDVTGLQPGVPGAGFERATATLDEAHERAEGIREQLIADGVLTREEVEEIRSIDLDDPEYIISSRRAELVDIAHVRAAQQRAYDKTVGRILKGGGIHPEMLIRDYGADGVQWLRSRFGLSIVSDNGQPLDVWAQTLSEEAPEADIRGDADRLYSLLRDEWPSKKKIDADYREYANSLREDIKSARERSSEREAYRRGELSPEKAERKAKLEKKVANLEALGTRASKTQMRNLEAYRAELDAMDAQDGATLEAEARGVEEFGPATIKTDIDAKAHEAATSPLNDTPEPTQAQKEAGNYKKAHVRIAGMDISIENPKGSTRKGVDEDGRAWETEMKSHYGYIKGSIGADKDHVDVFIGENPDQPSVFIVDQVNPKTGKFDEHKVVMGATSEQEARNLYLSNYEDGWQGLGAISEMPVEEFRKWVYSKKAKKPVVDISEPPTLPADQRTQEQAGGMASPGQRPSIDEQFDTMVKDAARWQGAARNLALELKDDKRASVRLSKITTKGDLDAYLMRKYGIDAAEARSVSNHLTARDIKPDFTATVEEFKDEPWAKEMRKEKPKPSKKTPSSGIGTTQRRAAVGGEWGANGEWYEGGKFIATTDRAKGKKKWKAPLGKVQVGPGKWEERPDFETADNVFFQPIFPNMAGIELYDRETDKFALNPELAGDYATAERLEARRQRIEAWNNGARWYPVAIDRDTGQRTVLADYLDANGNRITAESKPAQEPTAAKSQEKVADNREGEAGNQGVDALSILTGEAQLTPEQAAENARKYESAEADAKAKVEASRQPVRAEIARLEKEMESLAAEARKWMGKEYKDNNAKITTGGKDQFDTSKTQTIGEVNEKRRSKAVQAAHRAYNDAAQRKAALEELLQGDGEVRVNPDNYVEGRLKDKDEPVKFENLFSRLAKEKESGQKAVDVEPVTATRGIEGYLSTITNKMSAGRIKKKLSERISYKGKAMTRAEYVEAKLGEGYEPASRQEPKVKEMSRMASFRANNEQQRAHEKKMREAGNKTIYSLDKKDEGVSVDVTKIEHDYAAWVSSPAVTAATVQERVDSASPSQKVNKGQDRKKVDRWFAAVRAWTNGEKFANVRPDIVERAWDDNSLVKRDEIDAFVDWLEKNRVHPERIERMRRTIETLKGERTGKYYISVHKGTHGPNRVEVKFDKNGDGVTESSEYVGSIEEAHRLGKKAGLEPNLDENGKQSISYLRGNTIVSEKPSTTASLERFGDVYRFKYSKDGQHVDRKTLKAMKDFLDTQFFDGWEAMAPEIARMRRDGEIDQLAERSAELNGESIFALKALAKSQDIDVPKDATKEWLIAELLKDDIKGVAQKAAESTKPSPQVVKEVKQDVASVPNDRAAMVRHIAALPNNLQGIAAAEAARQLGLPVDAANQLLVDGVNFKGQFTQEDENAAVKALIPSPQWVQINRDKTVEADIPEAQKEKLTLKQQKAWLLAEIDKAMKSGAKTGKPFEFHVPGDGHFRIKADQLAEFKKRVEDRFPEKERPSALGKNPPRPVQSRKGRITEGEYYNEWQDYEVKLDAVFKPEDKDMPFPAWDEKTNVLHNGVALVVLPKKPALKGLKENKADVGSFLNYSAKEISEDAEIVGQFKRPGLSEEDESRRQVGDKKTRDMLNEYANNMAIVFAHVRYGNKEAFFHADKVDMLRTQYPDARLRVSKDGTRLGAFVHGKIVGLVMGVEGVELSDYHKARIEEIAAAKEGRTPKVKAADTKVETKQPVAEEAEMPVAEETSQQQNERAKPVTGRTRWFVAYSERNTGRTTELKSFATLTEAREFAQGKFGYISKQEDKGSGLGTDQTENTFKEYFGGFEPSAQEGQAMKSQFGEVPQAKPSELTTPKAEGKKQGEKIEDFGEKIEGAKKDLWTGLREKMGEVADDEIPTQPFSKIWPLPDYQAMIDSGMDKEAVAYLRAMRDAIPAKPRKGWKLTQWTELAREMRRLALSIMDGTLPADRVRNVLASGSRGDSVRSAIKDQAELYMLVGHEKSLAGLRIEAGEYSLLNGVEYKPPKVIWAVEQKQKATAFSNFPRMLATGATREEAIAEFKKKYDSLTINEPASKQVEFAIYSKRGEEGFFVGKKVGRNYIDLAGPLKTVKEAREYKRDNHDALVERLEKAKEIPNERRDTNNPRVGEDMRGGKDVTPEMFAEAFGFRGVQFGNYVEQGKRQKDLNDAYDALMDMAAILEIPPKAISLNGELGLAFGARGRGGKKAPSAHYEPGQVVINLTKREGAGSIGHEWLHALDNYFSRMRGKKSEMMTDALDVSLADRGAKYEARGDVRKEMIDAFGALTRAIRQTAIKARSTKLDNKRTKEYWTLKPEMTARAFESYLISKLHDQGASNDYLANIVDEATWKAAESLGFELEDSYPYPTAGEVPAIRAAFDEFFKTVETKETDKGVALYEEPEAYGDDDGSADVRGSRGRDNNSQQAGRGGMRPIRGGRLVELEAAERRSVPAIVRNEADAAAAVSFITRSAQENVVALVLDKEDRPISIIRHGIGKKNQALVDPATLVGSVLDVPDAASFYLIHNHPSGGAKLSKGDRDMQSAVRLMNGGSGVKLNGVLAITPSAYGTMVKEDAPMPSVVIGQKTVSVMDRMFSEVVEPQAELKVTGAKGVIENIDRITGGADSGVIFMNGQNVVTGFLPMTPAQMEKMRGDRLGDVLRAVHETNAISFIGVVPGMTDIAKWRNVSSLANAAGILTRDAIYRDKDGQWSSSVKDGLPYQSYGDVFYQTAPQAPTLLDIRAAFPWADEITRDGDRYVVRKGKNVFAVELVDRIDPDETAFRIAYKRAYDPKTDKIAGDYRTGTLRIAKGAGDNWTAKHEHYHFLEDMGLVTKFEQAVLDAAIKKADKAGTLGFETTTPAENRAYFVQAALEKRDFNRKTTIGRVLQKIADFVDALVNLAVRTSRGIVRDVESGKMMGRDGNAKAMMTQAFAGYQASETTETPAFKRWFGKSKAQGVFYHWTNNIFDSFSKTADIGFHFGTEASAKDRGAKVGGAEIGVEPVNVRGIDADTKAAVDGMMGGDPVSDLYALLLRKLDSPRSDLRSEIERMSVDEIKKTQQEYASMPDSSRAAERASRAAVGDQYRVVANGETLSVHKNSREARARADKLRREAAKPMAVYLRVENPIRLPDLGVWPAQGVAKESGFTPDEFDAVAAAGDEQAQYAKVREILKSKGYDGIVYTNQVEDIGSDSYIVFDSSQIKSVDNVGTFDPADPRIQYSLASATLAKSKEFASDVMHRPEVFGRFKWINTQLHKALKNPAFKRIFDRFHAAAGTQSRSAARAAGLAGDILPDYSGNAKQTLKRLFSRTTDFGREDLRTVSKIMSMETLSGKDASPFSGHRLTEDELAKLEAGKTITLGGNDITMTATQVKLYRQARAALDQMLNEMATSEAWKVMRGVLPEDLRDYWEVFANNPIEVQAAMENMLATELRNAETRATQAEKALFDFAGAKDMDEAKKYGRVLELLNRALKKKDKFSDKELENDDIDALIAKREERIEKLADALGISADNAGEHLAEYKRLVAADKDAKQHVLNVEDAQSKITDVFAKSQQLIKAGYAPLSRFGKYRIDVHNDKGDLIHVTFYDTSTEASRERRRLEAAFAGYPEGAKVGAVETVSEEDWKLFQGANPEAMRIFAQNAGADSGAAVQAYYQDAVSSRSSLKRLINRKGYAGYSDDLQRILASFITSGAKRVSANYHAAEIMDMVSDKTLPADLRDEANKLKQFVDNPGDAGSGFRAFAANWYMLGSFMSAAWNGTQVISSTIPELYKHSGSVARSSKDVGKAYRSIYREFRKRTDLTDSERAALTKAMEDGTVDAAEVHHLYAQATKRFIARLGDGAMADKAGSILRLWGMPFAWFETLNRKASFLAAYRMGEAQGMDVDEAYAFAKQIVDITQGIYVKHNRPNVARSAAGGAILTFMQYRIMTLEQITRNAKEGGQARKAAALQLAIIMAMGGWAAVPFAEDFMDILDAIMQVIGGKAWLTKKKLREAIEKGSKSAAGLLLEKQAADAVGQVMADFMNVGISTALPVNVAGRAGFGNIVPMVKLLKPSTQYRDSEVFDALGVPGSLVQSIVDASSMLLQGDVGRATMRMAPNALAAVAKGVDIATTGEIRNTRGRKITEGTPLDAAVQVVGGWPAKKAKISNKMRENQELKYLTQQEERSIVNEWADAYEKKGVVAQSAALKAVRERITEWNRKNPEWPIVVKQSQVMRELQNRRKTTVELASKGAPKELRKSMAVQ